MLTEQQKKMICQIVSDMETGRHLLRTEEEWKELGINKFDALNFSFVMNKALKDFDIIDVCDGENDKAMTEIAIYTALCYNHDFHEMVKNLIS